jgi:arsenate reductase-like glutaredoxin family protein
MNELELGEYLRTNGILKQELDSWIETARNSFDKIPTSSSETVQTKRQLNKLQAELKRKEKALAEEQYYPKFPEFWALGFLSVGFLNVLVSLFAV